MIFIPIGRFKVQFEISFKSLIKDLGRRQISSFSHFKWELVQPLFSVTNVCDRILIGFSFFFALPFFQFKVSLFFSLSLCLHRAFYLFECTTSFQNSSDPKVHSMSFEKWVTLNRVTIMLLPVTASYRKSKLERKNKI